jgi:hypothetical protein
MSYSWISKIQSHLMDYQKLYCYGKTKISCDDDSKIIRSSHSNFEWAVSVDYFPPLRARNEIQINLQLAI